jgi:hypothetical protein
MLPVYERNDGAKEMMKGLREAAVVVVPWRQRQWVVNPIAKLRRFVNFFF